MIFHQTKIFVELKKLLRKIIKFYQEEISLVKVLIWMLMFHQKVRELRSLFLNLNWKSEGNLKDKQVMKNNITKKWFKRQKDISCLKIKLYLKVDSRASQIIMIHIQELQQKSRNSSVLNNNGKLMVNFKEIQAI